MSQTKRERIEEQLRFIDERLSNAEGYVAKNVNIQGSSWLHFDDWRGKSGHPLWMKRFMIPALMKHRARTEKALETLDHRARDKRLARRRRHGAG
jgi:hypothetical protein